MLCFRENIFLIFEECLKNSRRRGGRKEREEKRRGEKRDPRTGEEGKYMPRKEERGAHAHFFLQRGYIFHLRDGARDDDNHDYESKQRVGDQ